MPSDLSAVLSAVALAKAEALAKKGSFLRVLVQASLSFRELRPSPTDPLARACGQRAEVGFGRRRSGGKPAIPIAYRVKSRNESGGCPPSPRLRGTLQMKYVYLIQSLASREQRYIGITTDLRGRIRAHNAGVSSHTSKYRPWKLVLHLCFEDDRRAIEFERYLKSGSGQAFAKKRFW